MNVFEKFDEIPSMILKVIKETKRYGHTVGWSDNTKTVYHPTNTICGGITICTVSKYENVSQRNAWLSQLYMFGRSGS